MHMKKAMTLFCAVVFFIIINFSTVYASAPAHIAEDTQQDIAEGPAFEKGNVPIIIAMKTDDAVVEHVTPGASHLIGSIDNNQVASKAVEKNVGLFSVRIKERFSLYLSRSGQYLELMKGILRSMDVPEDIVFLSLIESGFNPNAYSIARAAGPWQFISSTAKRYGLEINWWRDERRDPVKSTIAAASYLKDLYGMFGSWSLAMAAYNAGEGKISKAIKKNKSDDYWDLLGTRHIKNETKEYVPRFIAASMIASNPQEFGFDAIEYHEPMSYDEVMLESPIDLAVAAESAGVGVDVIKKLNPELRRWCTPPDVPAYILRIPKGTREVFLEKLASLPEESRLTMDKYTVKKGDTLKKIAKKTGIPENIILSLNLVEKIMPLSEGNFIYVPPKGFYVADKDDKRVKKVSHKVKVKRSRKVSSVSAKNHKIRLKDKS
ncbi:MAG: transglycosylase SLT domain-containing protein [Nitrospirae bacterium]|nr:transglycosylase SLT domain-containing protein [Nitrospirota bacterium]